MEKYLHEWLETKNYPLIAKAETKEFKEKNIITQVEYCVDEMSKFIENHNIENWLTYVMAIEIFSSEFVNNIIEKELKSLTEGL